MPTNYDTVRHLALALPGVAEGVCFGTPALYVGRTLLARLREDGETLVLKVEAVLRAKLFAEEPDTFYTTDHYRAYPVMLVNLLSVRASALSALVEGAWRSVAPKRLASAYDLARRQASMSGPTPP